MLKNLMFSGIFEDKDLSVQVTLENPSKYGLKPSHLPFSITITPKDGTSYPNLGNFAFYILDEDSRLYNAPRVHIPNDVYMGEDPFPDMLVCARFRPKFLYHDLRIAFFYKPYRKINIIELQH